MTEPPRIPTSVCTRCGAINLPDAKQCWLCSRGGQNDPYAAPSLSYATTMNAGAAQERSQTIYAALLFAAVGLSVIIGIGLATLDPGFLVAYLVVIAPAFLATGARYLYGVVRHEKTKPSALLTAFVSGLSFILVLGLLAVASLVALFLWCVWSLGGGAF